MFYVTMTDKVLSGWGKSKGKINKVVFECESYEEASIVYENSRERKEMIRACIRESRPWYSSARYFVSWKNKETSAAWYSRNWLRGQE